MTGDRRALLRYRMDRAREAIKEADYADLAQCDAAEAACWLESTRRFVAEVAKHVDA